MSPDPELPEVTPTVPDALAADQATAHVTGAHGHHGPFHTHCENCGTPLAGPFCHRCGQHDFEFHRSFRHVFLEALETLFHFEGKFFRNIVTLLFRPGQLTADFNAGKRAAQMPPFRLYIFVSFLFFLLIFLGEKPTDTHVVGNQTVITANQDGKIWPEISAAIKSAEQEESAKTDPAAGKETAPTPAATESAATARHESPIVGWPSSFEQKVRLLDDPAHREHLFASIKSHLPHLLMFCLPFFALYTRALFRKSGQVYLQHLVVAVHFHTFIYLWLLVSRGWTALAALPGWGLDSWVDFAGAVWLWLYPLLMLRRLFANSWGKTLVKTGLLAGAYSLTLGLGFLAMSAFIFLTA